MTQDYNGTATYDPADNKLRLYPFARLPKELYERVRGAGFIWAPKQELFVAPMWTPARADLLTELCGDIGDEDKSLVERSEERAERFEEYSEHRAQDADQAHKAVSAIADNIPLGQPILIGHHSEKHARKDAERIENGMRRAVKMWETSKYWEDRAAGAIRHAKHKERPDVRARRIKGIEADKRKQERYISEYTTTAKFWAGEMKLKNKETGETRPFEVNYENAIRFTGCDATHLSYEFSLAKYPRALPASQYEGTMSLYSALGSGDGQDHAIITVEQARDLALRTCAGVVKRCQRWIFHYENRLLYERAMLAEGGGLVAHQHPIAVGGQVLRRHGEWFIVTKVNLRDGVLSSVTVLGHFAATIPADEIQDYRPPQPGDWDKVKAVTTQPPICNYPGKGVVVKRLSYSGEDSQPADCQPITQAQWDAKNKDYKGTRVVDATATAARHRVRFGNFPRPEQAGYGYNPVYITDAKIKTPPAPDSTTEAKPALPARIREPQTVSTWKPQETPVAIQAMRESLKAGVQVVSAPQLFPTPADLAARVVELADIQPGNRVLEPSAGTGNLLVPMFNRELTGALFDPDNSRPVGTLVLVEQNGELAKRLRAEYACADVHQTDFLTCNGDLGKFDRIVMNPPFANGADIKHILHARKFLNPGGKLVAICANGPRQREALEPICDSWEDLETGTFKESGTNVNTALIVITPE